MEESKEEIVMRPSFATCIHLECRCRDEDIDFMCKEIQRDPRVINGGENHCPPLLHAVIKEHGRCVRMLLDNGAVVHEEYERLGETPLSLAVTRSTSEFISLLLAKDASAINTPSTLTHEPPLVRAVKHGNPSIVEVLLSYGARPDVCTLRNDEHIPVLYLALELGHESIVKMLLEAGASISAHQHFDKHNLLYRHLQFAIAEGQVESLKCLCLHGALHELNKLTLYPNLRLSVHYSFPLLCVLFRNSNALQINLRMLDMLYEFGFNFWKCDKNDKSVWKKFEKLEGNEFSKLLIYKIRRIRSRPLNLKLICRLKVQALMERNYVPNIDKLDIPKSLYSFLKFEYI